MMWGNCELKQVLVWASSCNVNSKINQLSIPTKNHIHLSFQLHNKIIYTLCNLIFQSIKLQVIRQSGREIAPNTGANATKFFILATKSSKVVAKLATRMLHDNHA